MATATCYLSPEELTALNRTELSRKAPFAIRCASMGKFNIAKREGGAVYHGWGYKYFPATDELVRHDVVKWAERRRRFAAKLKQAEQAQEQVDIFGGAA
jgi:hypothetical protein